MNTNYQFYLNTSVPGVSGIRKEVMIRTDAIRVLVAIELWTYKGTKSVHVSVTRLKKDYSTSSVLLDFNGDKAVKNGWRAFTDLVKMFND